jgi:DNA invertase Pin-like site-specific DNA recombinase
VAKLEPGDVVVVCDFDRISRDARELSTALRQLEDRGVSIVQTECDD